MSVATVARMLGVAPSTLRTWARRYGLEPSAHRSGLHRRYSAEDVSRLQLMRALTDSGVPSRDAAERARAADPSQLGVVSAASREGLPGDHARASMAALVAGGTRQQMSGRTGLEGLDPAVRTMLATAARADAIGTTALMRAAVRDLGAARTFDERLRPARRAARSTHGPVRERILATLDAAVVEAAGEVVPRRDPRNAEPVTVTAAAGSGDAAALVLCRAAFADRSIAAVIEPAAHSVEEAAARAVARGGCLALLVAERDAPRVVAALHASGWGGSAFAWGPGWVGIPGHAGGLADLVRRVEARCTSDG